MNISLQILWIALNKSRLDVEMFVLCSNELAVFTTKLHFSAKFEFPVT